MDLKLRELERQAEYDQTALLQLAAAYLRIDDPRIPDIMRRLRELDDPDAKKLISAWAKQANIPTATELSNGLDADEAKHADSPDWPPSHDDYGVGNYCPNTTDGNCTGWCPYMSLEKILAAVKTANFWKVETDESGRGGVYYAAGIYESPAGGHF